MTDKPAEKPTEEEDAAPEKEERARLKCPACTSELSRQTCELSGLEIDSCFYCRGLWFDGNELRRFFSSPKLYNKFRLPEHNFRVKIKNAPKVRKCARCEDQELVEATVDNVAVDECPACTGIWLDSGEISRLIELVEKGKLKGKNETVKQLKKGKFDTSALGQVSKAVGVAFKLLIGRT